MKDKAIYAVSCPQLKKFEGLLSVGRSHIWIEYRRMGDGTREVVASGALSALAEEVAQGRYG